MTLKRIGFACKWIDTPDQIDGIKPRDSARQYNTGTTTVAWLNRQTRERAEEKLWDLMQSNIESIRRLVAKVGEQPLNLRMVRLSSEILPVYTEPTWQYFWRQADVVAYCERHFRTVGDLARALNVRLSFHPGQFCCIVSANDNIVEKSLEELEYHADMMRWMGYGQSLLDTKINVHLSGKRGVEGFDAAWKRMSPELRNMLTIENDEFQAGLDVVLALKDRVGIVLDLHHNWVAAGEYINADDPRIQLIIESWCRDGKSRRPVLHYSLSQESVLTDHCEKTLPSMNVLLESGHKKAKLRAHSNFMWNQAANVWAYDFWNNFDFMVECKSKNIGSTRLFEFWKSLEK